MRIKIWSALSTGGGEGFRLAVVVADVDQAQNYVSNTLPRSGSRMVDYRIIPRRLSEMRPLYRWRRKLGLHRDLQLRRPLPLVFEILSVSPASRRELLLIAIPLPSRSRYTYLVQFA